MAQVFCELLDNKEPGDLTPFIVVSEWSADMSMASSSVPVTSGLDPYDLRILALRLDHAVRKGRPIDASLLPAVKAPIAAVTNYTPRRLHTWAADQADSTSGQDRPNESDTPSLSFDTLMDLLRQLPGGHSVARLVDSILREGSGQPGTGESSEPPAGVPGSTPSVPPVGIRGEPSTTGEGQPRATIRIKQLLQDFALGREMDSSRFNELLHLLQGIIHELGAVDAPEVTDPTGGADSERIIQESLGTGEAHAIATGTSRAVAQTGVDSVGNATAKSYGAGLAQANTGNASTGNAFAVSLGDGDAMAGTGERSTGNASAASMKNGNAIARNGPDSSGIANAQAQDAGDARALVGSSASGSATALSERKGNAVAETGRGSAGNAFARSTGKGDATARNGEISLGNAIALSLGDGPASAETGLGSSGTARATSHAEGAASAQVLTYSRGHARAEAFGAGAATAQAREESLGTAVAQASGPGDATAILAQRSPADVLAKATGDGIALAESGVAAKGRVHAIASSSGSAKAGTGDESRGRATAITGGPGDAVAITGDRSTGDATARADKNGGNAYALVTNESRGSVLAEALGKGDVWAVADGRGAVRAIAKAEGNIMVIHSGPRPLTVTNNSGLDIGITSLSRKAVNVDVSPSGIVNFTIAGVGIRAFRGSSFTILEDGTVVAENGGVVDAITALLNAVDASIQTPPEPEAVAVFSPPGPDSAASVFAGIVPAPTTMLTPGVLLAVPQDDELAALFQSGGVREYGENNAGATTLFSSSHSQTSGPARLDLVV